MDALKELVEGCKEEGMSFAQTLAFLPAAILAEGQRSPDSGLLNEPIQDLLKQAKVFFSESAFAEAIESALNGTLDFAAPMFGKGSRSGGKKPNCTAGKSHFCQTANGRGSCVPMSKKCKFKPSGVEKAAADWVQEKIEKFDGKNSISPAKKLAKTGDPLEDSLNRALRGADASLAKARKAKATLRAKQKEIEKSAKEALDKFDLL